METNNKSAGTQIKNPKLIIVVSAFTAFLATFNETYLNIAFTPIMQDTGVGVATVQWLAAAYMLGAAVMVPVSAFAYRSIPTRILFVATTALLVIGSVIGALAQEFNVLLIGRIVQALGTGMLIPIGMNITLEVAPREKLGAYMGIMGAMTTLGPSLSVIVSGLLLSVGSWHLLLWVFAGLSMLCLLCGAVFLRDIAYLTKPRLDAASVALIGLALIGILYGISTVFTGSALLAAISIAIGILCLVAFLQRQGKLAEPLIDLRPLKVAPFAAGVTINMISLIVIFSMNIIMPIFMQSNMGASAMRASLTLFPAIVLCCIVAPIAGRIYYRLGAYNLLPIGFLLICIFACMLTLFRDSGSTLIFALMYIPVICGSALIIGPVQSFALSFLKPELNPHGVTVMSTGFQIAGCIGSSVFTGIYAAVLSGKMTSGEGAGPASEMAFLVTVLAAAACALIGAVLSISLRRFRNAKADDSLSEGILEQIMKKEVYTVYDDDTLVDALQYITEKKISGAPVTDHNGKLVGFISDGDILRHLSKLHPVYESVWSLAAAASSELGFDSRLNELMQMQVKEVGIRGVIAVKLGDSLEEVCRVLQENHLKKAPVLDGADMVGVINSSNITKFALSKILEKNRK